MVSRATKNFPGFVFELETRQRAAAERVRVKIMETLLEEGRAIFDSVAKESAAQNAKNQQDLKSFISQSVDAAIARAVEETVRPCITKAQADMQVYTDGVESTLLHHLESTRAQMGLAATEEPDPLHRQTASDAEIGPDGRSVPSTTRRSVVGPSGF